MYCPDCGKENPAGQKFCRSCGLSLKPISQALAGEVLPDRVDKSSTLIVQGEPRFWHNPLIYGLLVIVLGIIIGAVGDKVLSSQTIRDIGTIISLLGVGLIGVKGVMLIVAPPRYSLRSQPTRQAEQTSGLEPRLLAAEPPSVTENTTRQLEASVESRERSQPRSSTN
jgi:zinc ribbon protein